MVKIASFNVENLFARPKAFDSTDWSIGEPVLNAYRNVNALFLKTSYSEADKQEMLDHLVTLDIYRKNDHNAVRRVRTQYPKWAWMRKNRGKFDRQPKDSTQDVTITAKGREDWIGWVELAKEPTNEKSIRMTAEVIKEIDADIIGIVEAEDRPSLVRFNKDMLGGMYQHVMLVDGNDERGIDVGIMTKTGFEIESIRSNVDVEDSSGIVFSRDCPQYKVHTPVGNSIHILVNHFKSQSGGGDTKRQRQAAKVREIVNDLAAQNQHVVVLGDLNEGPSAIGSQAVNLMALYDNSSPLVDCFTLQNFDVGNRPGTFDSCGIRNRFDYIFLSQNLVPNFSRGEVFRKGLWGNRLTRPTDWTTYPQMVDSSEQASDHAAVVIELNI